MKILVVSDIHGSYYYAKKFKEIYEKENPDKIILLGDLYYHGPRNSLTEEYNPMKVAGILNDYKFNDNIELTIDGVKFFFTHGHVYNMDNVPENIDVLVYGHLHTGFIEEENGVVFVNSGSISLPKNNTAHSYLIIEDKNIILKDVDGNVIKEFKLK